MVGKRIGPYQIVSLLGAGGMGEVYRARDARLGRDVAIKVLPRELTADPDRAARFEREARALAALNHPHIASIYGVEPVEGGQALVLELVDGETLAARIEQIYRQRAGGLALTETLTLARQIAEALDTAHEKGIVHRDLKPANVKITPDGVAKVLDFGLAKLTSALDDAEAAAGSPTRTDLGTRAGLIIGTAGYMSPEQARGQSVDKRTDIWAFGCVLYEMLTGRPAFARPTITDSIAAVVDREPDWSALPDTVPAAIRRLLRRCLEKDVKRRLRDIADAGVDITDALAPTPISIATAGDADVQGPDRSRTWRTIALVLGLVAAVSVGVAVWNLAPPAAPATRQVRFAIQLPPGTQFPIDQGLPQVLAISPDGTRIVYAARDASGHRLYLRGLDDLEGRPIPGTDGAIGPFFSPDSQSIGFGSGGMLRTVSIAGGGPQTLTEAPNLEGATWAPDGTIFLSPRWTSGLQRVAGGKTNEVTPVEEADKSPHVLPGGNALLFQVLRNGRQVLEALELATGRRRTLVDGSNPFFVDGGQLLFGRAGIVFAAPFDPVQLELRGEPRRVLDGVAFDGNDTHFAVARNGTVVYVPAVSSRSRLVWVDRAGATQPLDNELREYAHPRISPDGKRVVVRLEQESGGGELWVYDVDRGTRARLSPSGRVSRPIFTSDGTHITFQLNGHLYSISADDRGEPELMLEHDDRFTAFFPLAWSRTGGALAFSAVASATNRNVWVLPASGTMTPFLNTARDERAAMFSPDGKWLVYAIRETGREEQVYIQPFPGPGSRVVVSVGGGIEPVWSPAGGEIFYRSIDGASMMGVDVRTQPTVTIGEPRALFAGRFPAAGGSFWSDYDVTPDGQRFLMLEAQEPSTPRLNVMTGWMVGSQD